MKSILKKKTYYLITHPDLPGYSVTNYGDRKFRLNGRYLRATTISTVSIDGDENWDITEKNILAVAEHLLEEEIEINKKEIAEEKAKESKLKKWWRFWNLFTVENRK